MTDKKRDDYFSEKIDKLNGFAISQRKVFIKTKPSVNYPKGKFYNGIITLVLWEKKKIRLLDDIEGVVEIYLSEIASPADIELSRRED